jgi:hypothetical protein
MWRSASIVIAALAAAGCSARLPSAGPISATTGGAKELYGSTHWNLRGPPGATSAELVEVQRLLLSRKPLPEGWEYEFHGEIAARRTEVKTIDGSEQILVTLAEDRAEDLESAELRVGERTVFRADRDGGAIVDTDQGPIASLTFFLPPVRPQTVELRWRTREGEERAESLTLREDGTYAGTIAHVPVTR